PTIDLKAHRVGEPVRQRCAVPGNTVAAPHGLVNFPQLLKLFPSTCNVVRRVSAEKVLIAHQDQERLGSERVEQVPSIETNRAGTNEVLLGVIGRPWRVEVRAGHVLGVRALDGCGSRAVVQAGAANRGGTSARLSGRSEPR